MSFRAAFTCQDSKQLKNKPANMFFCLHWEQVFGHLISPKQAQEYFQSAYGDAFLGKRRYHWKEGLLSAASSQYKMLSWKTEMIPPALLWPLIYLYL